MDYSVVSLVTPLLAFGLDLTLLSLLVLKTYKHVADMRRLGYLSIGTMMLRQGESATCISAYDTSMVKTLVPYRIVCFYVESLAI